MSNFIAYLGARLQEFNQPIVLSRTLQRGSLAAIIVIFTVLTLFHSLVSIPIFEGYDEQRHYAYARYLVNNHTLPPRTQLAELEYNTYKVGQESGQPPLYYIPVALLTSLAPDADDVAPYVIQNSFNNTRDDLGLIYDNHNRYLHGPEGWFPFQNVALAVHLGRLVSVALGILTLLGIYGIARTLAPAQPALALLAVGMVAAIPRFIYLHGIITSDTAVILFTTISVWMAVRIAREGATVRLALLGGLFAGLTALSKLNGAWVAGIVWMSLLGAAFIHRRERSLRASFLALALSMVVWGLITGWWFVYGEMQGGDPLGTAVHAVNAGHILEGTFLSNLSDWEQSVWGVGWPLPPPFRFLYPLGWIGAAGLAVGTLIRKRTGQLAGHDLRPAALQAICLILVMVLSIAGGLYWQLYYGWRLGRLLFPGLTSAAVLAAVGWGWWLDRLAHWRRLRLPQAAYWAFAAAMFVYTQGAAVFGAIQIYEVYVPHTQIPITSAGVIQTQLTFLDPTDNRTPVAQVIGYRLPAQDIHPGGIMLADICWKSTGYRQRSFPYAMQLVGPNDVQPGTRNSYHGLGAYPLIAWKPGEEFCDPTSLRVTGDVDQPLAYKLVITLFDLDPANFKVGPTLTAIDGAGKLAYPVIDRVRVAPDPSKMPTVTPTVNLGGVAGLAGSTIEVRPDGMLSATVRWVALGTTEINAHVYLHLLDSNGHLIAQDDHEPGAGWFPTNYWQQGDVIDDHFQIVMPPGADVTRLNLRLGMYDTQTQVRFHATAIASGEHLRDDEAPLTP